MNRTIFSLLVLLLFGLLSQPSIAQSRQQASQRSAEENVAKMSEAEMRAHLPRAKERLKMSQSALKTGNYSQYLVGDDAIAQGVAKAVAEAEYYYYTTLINEIEKRLSKIDSQKPKPQTEQQQQAETEQQQQEIPDQNLEEQRQIQAKLQQSFNEKLAESQPRFNQLHTNVDAYANAASNRNVAANLVRGNKDPNSRQVTDAMLDKPLSTNSNPNSVARDGRIGISGKFNKQKSEEPKKEEPEETKQEPEEESQNNQDLDAEIRKLLQELENDISNFPKEDL